MIAVKKSIAVQIKIPATFQKVGLIIMKKISNAVDTDVLKLTAPIRGIVF
jgi:hypothetical protein